MIVRVVGMIPVRRIWLIQKASPLVSEVKLFDIYRGANLGEGTARPWKNR